MKKQVLDQEFIDSLKDRIEINEQIKRFSKIMQQSYLAARGKLVLSKSQVEASKTFMMGFKTSIGRFIPELKAIEHMGEIGHRHVSELSTAELEAIAAGGRAGVDPEETSGPGPAGIH